jgi:FtsP/CotA-like multicopper oxidase with cupredoxin domain
MNPFIPPFALKRRRFTKGAAAAGALAFVPWPLRGALAAPRAPVLSGTEFQLDIGPVPMNVTGRPVTASGINGQIPAPILRWREGDTVTLAVTNRLNEPSSIHWHGIRTPSPMDGVPGLSFHGIPPGETFVYRFPVNQSGTYWYHSHSAFQEQTGIYGPIVIIPKGGYTQAFDRDYIVMFSDWTDENPDTIVSNLKFQSDYYNFHQRTLGTFMQDVEKKGLENGRRPPRMGQDAHESDRHSRRIGRDLHLPDQWATARSELDSAVPSRRAREAAFHQRLFYEHFRCAH